MMADLSHRICAFS